MASDPKSLMLRPVGAADWSSIHEWGSTDEACRYQPWGPNTVQDTKRFVADAVAAWKEDPQDRYVWVVLSDRAKVVGLGELRIRSRRWGHADIGYAVHNQYWGRGIATVVAAALARFAFDQLDLHRVAATCDPRNVASAAVLRKVGMTYEGRLRHTMQLRDGWRDSDVFSLLAGEALASPPAVEATISLGR